MKIILYKSEYRDQLSNLLTAFSTEVYGYGKSNVDLFVRCHHSIYLAEDNGNIVGFSSYNISDYYGLREPAMANDYLYVDPKSRSGKVMYLFAMQTGRIIDDTNLSLEHYIASDSSKRFVGRLKGKKIYCTYIYAANEVRREFNRLRTKLKIKD